MIPMQAAATIFAALRGAWPFTRRVIARQDEQHFFLEQQIEYKSGWLCHRHAQHGHVHLTASGQFRQLGRIAFAQVQRDVRIGSAIGANDTRREAVRRH
jgi:hypothetical protein